MTPKSSPSSSDLLFSFHHHQLRQQLFIFCIFIITTTLFLETCLVCSSLLRAQRLDAHHHMESTSSEYDQLIQELHNNISNERNSKAWSAFNNVMFPNINSKNETLVKEIILYMNGSSFSNDWEGESCTLEKPCDSMNKAFKYVNELLNNDTAFFASGPNQRRLININLIIVENFSPHPFSTVPFTYGNMYYTIEFSSLNNSIAQLSPLGQDFLSIRTDVLGLYFRNLVISSEFKESRTAAFFFYNCLILAKEVICGQKGGSLSNNDAYQVILDTVILYKSVNMVIGSHRYIEMYNFKTIGNEQDQFNIAVMLGNSQVKLERIFIFNTFFSLSDIEKMDVFNGSSVSSSFSISKGNLIFFSQFSFKGSFSPDIEIFYAEFLNTVTLFNCHASEASYFLFLNGVFQVYMQDCEIRNINAANPPKKMAAAINIVNTASFGMLRCTFKDNIGTNGGDIYLDSVHSTSITSCKMENSTSLSHGGSIYSKTSKTMRYKVTFAMIDLEFKNCHCSQTGGAIYIKYSDSLMLNQCKFLQNHAWVSGGAIMIAEGIDIQIDRQSFFSGNKVMFIDKERSPHSGGGGAITISSAQSVLLEGFLKDNKAFRGGGAFLGNITFYIKQKTTDFTRAYFVNNEAFLSGGALFFAQPVASSFLQAVEFVGNTADKYGSDFTGSISRLLMRNTEKKSIIPGAEFNIALWAYDLFGNNISSFDENITVHSNYPLLKVVSQTMSESTSLSLTVYLTNKTATPSNHHPILLYFKSFYATTTLRVNILPCPQNWRLARIASENPEVAIYGCVEEPRFPEYAIVAIVICSVLFFTVGILFGIGIVYLVVKVLQRLAQLSKKEKAERELEQKILDKKVIFETDENDTQKTSNGNSKHSASSSLLESDYLNNNSNQHSSFIIPIEDIKIKKKIGEGGKYHKKV